MRVLHLSRGFEDYLCGLLGGLSGLCENALVLSQKSEWLRAELPASVFVPPFATPPVRDINNWASQLKLRELIHEWKPDLVHMQSGLLWELLLFHWFPELPVVLTVHDVVKHPMRGRMRFFPQSLLDYGGRRASAVIVHGESLVKVARERYRRAGGVHALPHGVIARYGTSDGSVTDRAASRVIFFGTIDAWKGVETLVAMAGLLKEKVPALELRVSGNCTSAYYRAMLEAARKQYGDWFQVSLRRQSDEEVREHFLWADAIVLPYIEASQSGVLQVAMAYCVPPVVTRVGALAEVVTNEVNGLVVSPNNPTEIADSLARLLGDKLLRRNVISSMRRLRDSTFSWEAIAAQTVALYEKVVADSKHVGRPKR